MNTRRLSYLFVAIALILVLSAAVLTVVYNTNYAYADYQDIIDNPNFIVNFNQYYSGAQPLTISGTYGSTSTQVYSQSELSLNENDFFYCYTNYDGQATLNFYLVCYNNGSFVRSVVINNNIVSVGSGVDSFAIQIFAQNGSINGSYYFNCINLTQMFGSNDNIPNLEQAKNIFVARYYPYNTGSPMSFSTIESYNKGVEDTLNSFDLTLSQYLVGSSAFAFYNSTISDSTISYDNTVNAYVFKNVIGVPLMGTIEFGTNFTVDFTLWDLATGESQSYYMSQYLNFGYVDSNNNLITISKLPSSAYVGEAKIQYTGVFVLPVSTDTIYIWVTYQNDLFSDDSFIALDSNITFRSLNVASLIKASYAAGLQYNKDFYSVGGAGYDQIFQSGYNAGTMAVTPYTFSRLLTAVIEAPLGAVLEIFNFDFMGYNFKNFITIMFTLCLIIAIVRMFMGGKE